MYGSVVQMRILFVEMSVVVADRCVQRKKLTSVVRMMPLSRTKMQIMYGSVVRMRIQFAEMSVAVADRYVLIERQINVVRQKPRLPMKKNLRYGNVVRRKNPVEKPVAERVIPVRMENKVCVVRQEMKSTMSAVLQLVVPERLVEQSVVKVTVKHLNVQMM